MGSSLDEQHIAHERFRLVQRIGNGRWSTVFLAEDGTLNQSVALKVVRPKTGSAAHLRLLREAEATEVNRLWVLWRRARHAHRQPQGDLHLPTSP